MRAAPRARPQHEVGLGPERGPHLLSDLVAAGSDRRSERGHEVTHAGAARDEGLDRAARDAAAVPRQPACAAATDRRRGSTSRIGRQSAVSIPSSSPGASATRRVRLRRAVPGRLDDACAVDLLQQQQPADGRQRPSDARTGFLACLPCGALGPCVRSRGRGLGSPQARGAWRSEAPWRHGSRRRRRDTVDCSSRWPRDARRRRAGQRAWSWSRSRRSTACSPRGETSAFTAAELAFAHARSTRPAGWPRASPPSAPRIRLLGAGSRRRTRSRSFAPSIGPPVAAAVRRAPEQRLTALGASATAGQPDPRAPSRRRAGAAAGGRLSRFTLLARMRRGARDRRGGGAALSRLRARRRRRAAPVQPRPQRRLARAPLAGAPHTQARDGGALRAAAPPRRRLSSFPISSRSTRRATCRAHDREQMRAFLAVARRVSPELKLLPWVGGLRVGYRRQRAGVAPAQRSQPTPADRRRGAGADRRGLRRHPSERGAGRRRQRGVPGDAARPAHGARRAGGCFRSPPPVPRPLGLPAGTELRLEPRVLRSRRAHSSTSS